MQPTAFLSVPRARNARVNRARNARETLVYARTPSQINTHPLALFRQRGLLNKIRGIFEHEHYGYWSDVRTDVSGPVRRAQDLSRAVECVMCGFRRPVFAVPESVATVFELPLAQGNV